MGKLAFQLGRAFTKGRKSAPAEFREVENQLYSLSAALQAFKTASRDGSASLRVDVSSLPTGSRKQDETADNEEDEDDVLAQVLRSCEQTLAHLESIVQKYGSIGRPRVQDAGQPRFRRWNDGLKHAWKTISWTTEGGDLATLRSNLTVHTNGLNLLLGVIVKYVGPCVSHSSMFTVITSYWKMMLRRTFVTNWLKLLRKKHPSRKNRVPS